MEVSNGEIKEILQRLSSLEATLKTNQKNLDDGMSEIKEDIKNIMKHLGSGGERISALETAMDSVEERLDSQHRWRLSMVAAILTALAASIASFFTGAGGR